MGQLVLVRHGETEWSRTGQHTGRTDIPLTPRGEEQARALGARLGERPFVRVVSSPLQRASRTAQLAGLDAELLDGLVEWDYGPEEGRTTKQAQAEVPGWTVWSATNLGETVAEVGRRAERVLEQLAPELERGDVCAVGHGHALRVLTAVWLGLPPEAGRLFAMPTASMAVLGHEHEAPVLVGWGL